MNRKDFEAIAKIIKAWSIPNERYNIAQHFAAELDGKHSGFEPARFLKSCGISYSPAATSPQG